jgi:uridine kinase
MDENHLSNGVPSSTSPSSSSLPPVHPNKVAAASEQEKDTHGREQEEARPSQQQQSGASSPFSFGSIRDGTSVGTKMNNPQTNGVLLSAGSFRSPSPGGASESSPFLGHHQKRHEKEGARLLKNQLRLARHENGGLTIEAVKDELSFDKGFFLFVRALQLLVKKKEQERSTKPVIVGLAGPSGAGKTVFSSKVQSLIPGCAVLSMDMYNDASRLVDGNFDDPRLTDYDLLLKNIEGLRNGQTVKAPIYDFKTSTRTGYRTVPAPKSQVVIVEGIYALTSKLRDRMDLRVSITGGVHFDLVKRVLRDISRSGQEPAEIIQQISETVYPMYKAFIEPDLKTAHLRIYNEFNPFSGFQNPIYTLKSSKEMSEERLQQICPELCINRVESEFHDIYLLPPTEDPETCNSWLRMRNKNGKYKLMFEEWVKEGDFIISPGISFEVSVRILGGLLALGYSIYLIMQRRTVTMGDDQFQIKLDDVEGLGRNFLQIQGKGRLEVLDLAHRLELENTYIPYPYIEQVQLENMTQQMREKTESMLKGSFNLPGIDDLDELVSVSPVKGTGEADGRGYSGNEYFEDMYQLSTSSGGSENGLSLKHSTSKENIHELNELNKRVEDLTRQVSALSHLGGGGGGSGGSSSSSFGSDHSNSNNEPNPSGNSNSNERVSTRDLFHAVLKSQHQTSEQIAHLARITSSTSLLSLGALGLLSTFLVMSKRN